MNFKADVAISPLIVGLLTLFEALTCHHVFTYVALVTLSTLALISRFCFRTGRSPPQHQTPQRTKPRSITKAIHAVHTLITPSHGPSWPMRYHELAARADLSRSDEITLPLDLVVRDFISGLIQIREYEACFPGFKPAALRAELLHPLERYYVALAKPCGVFRVDGNDGRQVRC